MITFGSDVADLILQRTLGENTLGLNNSINRMTTGYKVNQAKDNAAGYSIITDLSKKISSMLQVQQNTEDGIALLQTAEGGLEEVQKLLERLRDLATQASNGTYDAETREAMQAEADQISEQISQIRESIKYDNQNLYYQENNGRAVSRINRGLSLDADSSITPPQPSPSREGAQDSTPPQPSPSGEGVLGSTLSQASLTSSLSVSSPLAGEVTEGRRGVLSEAAASTLLEGAEAFAGGETRTIIIDGVQYTVKNKLTTANDLSYSKDTSTGELTLLASDFYIKTQDEISHNLIVNGCRNEVHGGNLSDKIVMNNNGGEASVYGEAGDDEIIVTGSQVRIRGGDGNDTITGGANVYGDAGDDIINVTQNYAFVYGGIGNDSFNAISGNSLMRLYGEAGDDHFNITSGNDIIVDGGEGTNTVVDNGRNTIKVNVIGSNAYSVEFAKNNETKTVTINGINYEVTNDKGGANTLIYTIEPSGIIGFKSSYFTIKGELNKTHNVNIGASYSNINFYGGNQADTIVLNGDGCRVYGLGGDDNITTNCQASVIDGGEGNDTLVVGGNRIRVYGGSGNDNITIRASYSSVDAGEGDDFVDVRNNNLLIYGGTGNNTISDNGQNTFINGFGDKDNAEAVILSANSSKDVVINGIKYNIKNTISNERVVLCKQKPITGEISFCAVGGTTITGQNDVAHNVSLYGYAMGFYGANLADTITDFGFGTYAYGLGGNDTMITNGYNSKLWGGDGNDTLTMNTTQNCIYGGQGDDIINLNSVTSQIINGGDGNDTYNINVKVTDLTDTGGDNIYNVNANDINISGGPGADTFYLSGNNNTVLGAGGDDYFVIDGSNNFIDGGTGNNYYIDNGTGTSFSNVNKDPNAGGISFTYQGEVKTFTLNGKTYTVTNNFAGSNMLQYSLNPNTGVITLNGSNFGVNAELNESAILNIRGNNNVITGSDLSDKITVEQGSNNVINGGKGNDTLIMNSENNSLNGGEGNDNITLNASTNLEVTGGAGADTININSDNNTNISSGAGNDVIKVNGAHNNINTGEGNNSITVNKDNNTINSGDGDNKYVITSSSNTVTSGKGNNSIGVQGDDNNITTQNAKGDINIYGNNNTVSNTRGENHITISGNNNTYSTTTGSKEINIIGNTNNILSGSGDDQIEVKGDNNTIESTSGNNEISIKGDANTIQGGAGQDNIKINGDNNIANGGAESDSFMVSNGNNNTIDGEGGERNTLIDNGKNTVYTNAVDITPRPFELNIKVDIGSGSDKYISTSISFNLFDFSVDFSTAEGALESLESIDEMLSSVSDQLLNIGNTINRLESVSEAQSIKLNNLISFRSTMRDADIAEESSNYIRYQILQQASATLLASSRNLKAQNVIALLNSVNKT